ncbi:MAG: hypothetical protein H0U59_00895 [Gemmatimonadaceae bacterium]|nr:hypothetical protein [Gemmatimonadaceae bacterium]
MSPEASDEASTTNEAPEAAPVVDSPAESTTDQGGDYSFADAFAEAQAEVTGETEAPAQDPVPAESTEGTEEPASDEAEPAAPESTPDKPVTEQGALQRIQTLVAQGREAELNAIERGVLNRIRSNIHEETKQQETFRDAYLDLLNKESEEPEAFTRWLREDAKGPDALTFMREYGRLHPDVSLEFPQGKAATPSPDQVRAEYRTEIGGQIEEMLEQVATDAGLPADTYARVKGESEGMGSFLGKVVTEAVKAQVAKELPRIQAEERKAAELQAQAQYANKTIVAPRTIGGAPQDPRTARPSGNGSTGDSQMDWREAFAEAQEELARSR